MKILAFIEQRDGKIKQNAYETLTLAHKLAGSHESVAAVIIGEGISSSTSELQGWGAEKLYVADDSSLKYYNTISYSSVVEEAISSFQPDLLLAPASPMGRDFTPRLSARLDAGIVTDATDIKAEGDDLITLKPMYAGKCLAEVKLQGSKMKIVTIRPNVFPAEKVGAGSASVETLTPSTSSEINLKTKEIRKGDSEKADLTEAARIISGGRAMGNGENFSILDSCAEVLGATVGASRAAVDSGYCPHTMQVGQTGKTVNPNLYIACGISGSIQHMAGMRTSKVIVAINTDPDAPIFSVADYGIVADLFEAVPLMTEKLKSIL